MYTEKEKALALYDKTKSIAEVIRRLGYPSRQAMYTWIANRNKPKGKRKSLLDEFYKQKIRQIHIVGEYANLMVRDYDAALQFVQDYFNMEFKKFIAKYFKGERVICQTKCNTF